MAFIPFPFGAFSSALSLLVMQGISLTMFRAFLNQTIPSLETLRMNDKYHITFSRPAAMLSSDQKSLTGFEASQPISPTPLPLHSLTSPNSLISSFSKDNSNMLDTLISAASSRKILSSPNKLSLIHSSPKTQTPNMIDKLMLASAPNQSPEVLQLPSPFTSLPMSYNPYTLNSIPSSSLKSYSSLSQQPISATPYTSPISLNTLPIGKVFVPGSRITFTPILSKRIGLNQAIVIPFSLNLKSSQNKTIAKSKKKPLPIIKEISISNLQTKMLQKNSFKLFSSSSRQIIPTIRRVCYYLLHQEPSLPVHQLDDLEFCTHLIISHAKIDDHMQLSFVNAYTDSLTLRALQKIRQMNKGLKLLLSVDTSGLQTKKKLHKFAENDTYLRKFVYSALELIVLYELDGLDINLAFECNEVLQEQLRIGNLKMLQMLRFRATQVGLTDLLLSALLSSSPCAINAFYNLEEMNNVLDFANIIAYDLHMEDLRISVASHHSPLYSEGNRYNNLDRIAQYWHNSSIAKHKINIGLSTFGRTYNLAFNNVKSINVPIAGLGMGNGTVDYKTVCKFVSQPESTFVFNEQLQVPFAYNGYDLITFENPKSLSVKAKYINKMHFGGIMIFALNYDDYEGKCQRSSDGEPIKYPLHNSIYRTVQFAGMESRRIRL